MEDRRQAHCKKCGVVREYRVNLRTGEFLATIAESCPTKEDCYSDLMMGYKIAEPALPVPNKEQETL